jgi:hypothetical protein
MDNAKRLMFRMTVSELAEFYERCLTQGATTERDRVQILVDMALEGYPVSVSETSRSDKQIIEDTLKHYPNIIVAGLTPPDIKDEGVL